MAEAPQSQTPATPPPRTSLAVRGEYNNTLFQVGVAQRAIYEKEREIKIYQETLDKLHLEFNQLVQQEQKTAEAVAKAKAEAAAKETPATTPPALAVVPSEAQQNA
jgi:hypothetical protein